LDWGTVGGKKREWGGGGQFTSNLGPGWTRIAPHRKEGFQVSKRYPGARGVLRGVIKGLRHKLILSICTYISYYCVNVANKRIVFRL
jgi:hypothetical protein